MKIQAGMTASLGLALMLAGCSAPRDESNIYTLYRSSAVSRDPISRYLVATFDASEAPPYNKQNCEIVARLWLESGVQIKYWCESGRFHL